MVPFKTIGVIRTRGRLICTGDVNSIAGAVQARRDLQCRDLQNVESSTTVKLTARAASAAPAASLCAGHAQQLGGVSPPANLMEVKA